MPVERIYYFEYERAYYCEPKDYQSYLSSHESEIDALCSILADERSRETLEGILKLWCSANPKYLRGIYTPDQYFPNDVLRLTSKESFVDCGAYTGDTYVQFKEAVKGEYHRYFGFEPHTESCAILQATVGVNERNICFGIGLSDKHETLRFLEANEVGTASAINNGQVVIKTVTLDEIISDEVTFIKMDIEGSELAALRGSEQTIRKNKPKLAICVYHKAEDLVEIPRFIMSLGLDYRFYLRHHQRHSGTETVFYAI
jgi:FkbM family methyltransferase